MDSNIVAAFIGAGGGLLVSLIIFFLGRFYSNYDKRKIEEKNQEISLYKDRNTDYESDQEFIFLLPSLKREVFSNCHINWDTGITLYMCKGNDDLIWFLRFCWLSLARFFPEKHFSKKGHDFYIDEYIIERGEYYYTTLGVADQVRSGSISRVILGNCVANDLDYLITGLVDHILLVDNPKKEQWFKEWNSIGINQVYVN